MNTRIMSSIAVVVLTCDEEATIARCLSHLKWADELVVVDSGSEDCTIDIAKAHGARVVVHEMCPFNASAQRNWMLEYADLSSEWVLFIDADEVVTRSLAFEIRKVINSTSEEIVAFQLTPKFMFMGRWLRYTMGYPAWHDRLLRKGALTFRGTWPRDTFENCDHNKIGRIYDPYLHFGFEKGIARWVQKHNVYSTNVSREVVSGEKPHSMRHRMEHWFSHRLFLGPVARFLYVLIARRGFLDGVPGIVYALMMSMYQFMICLKVYELKRRADGLPM